MNKDNGEVKTLMHTTEAILAIQGTIISSSSSSSSSGQSSEIY